METRVRGRERGRERERESIGKVHPDIPFCNNMKNIILMLLRLRSHCRA